MEKRITIQAVSGVLILLSTAGALSGCVSIKAALLSSPIRFGHIPSLEEKIVPKTYFVKTSDGWNLELVRYRMEKSEPIRKPVILLHGFHHNAKFWDLDENHAFSRYLAVRQFDVWALSFRGAGGSTTEGFVKVDGLAKFFADNVPPFLDPRAYDKYKMKWTIDDYIQYDLPAAVTFVKEQTGQDRVILVGHSLGGLVIYGYLEKENMAENVEEFVSIGAAGCALQPPNDMLADVGRNETLYYSTFLINAKLPAQLGAVLERHVTPFDILFYNRFNMDRKTLILMFAWTIEDVSLGVLDQLREMIRTGHFWSADKRYDYTENLSRIATPGLFISGVLDNISAPGGVQYAYSHVASTDRVYREFSTVNGYRAEYGHSDLILGRYAKEDVYAYIYHWMTRKNSRNKP